MTKMAALIGGHFSFMYVGGKKNIPSLGTGDIPKY